MRFSFFKKRIKGKIVDLAPTYTIKADASNQYVNSYLFNICLHDSMIVVGKCDLRVGMNEELYYLGQIGYSVIEEYRGNHYAYQACLLLFELAKEQYGMEDLIITCNPDNLPSRKTLEKLGGELIEIADVPTNHYCYKIGDYQKCIFRYDLRKR